MYSSTRWILFLVYIVLGLYLINTAIPFFDMPNLGEIITKALAFICGVLLVVGAFTFFRFSRYRRYRGY